MSADPLRSWIELLRLTGPAPEVAAVLDAMEIELDSQDIQRRFGRRPARPLPSAPSVDVIPTSLSWFWKLRIYAGDMAAPEWGWSLGSRDRAGRKALDVVERIRRDRARAAIVEARTTRITGGTP